MPDRAVPVGGAFLLQEGTIEQTLIPEELSSEARLMAKSMEEFMRKEVLPLNERIEAHEEGLMRSLVQQSGKLGLLRGG